MNLQNNQSNSHGETNNPIEAILFDMGGTLRKNIKRNEGEKADITRQILDLLGLDTSAWEFSKLLTDREEAYEKWASESWVELDEARLWTEWMLPEWPKERISKIALVLNHIWRDAIGTRILFPETKATILALYKHGYRLGLVSNTTSSVDTPLTLKKEGIAEYFEVTILSCVVGKRKPGPDILLEAVNRMGLLPNQCAYVGDRPDWDVRAARSAGFGQTVLLRNPINNTVLLPTEQTPDYFIGNLLELLNIFPVHST